MTRAGEKLHGKWNREPDYRLFSHPTFWRGFLHMTLLIVVAVAALFGFS